MLAEFAQWMRRVMVKEVLLGAEIHSLAIKSNNFISSGMVEFMLEATREAIDGKPHERLSAEVGLDLLDL